MHCHSTRSDGKNAPQEVILEAQRKNLDFLALTDHDIISSSGFQSDLRRSWIETCDSVEVSARNYELWKSLHLVSYAKTFSSSLHDILDSTRTGKVKMYHGQIKKLVMKGFVWSIQGFENYMQEKHQRWLRSANKWFLAHYLFKNSDNKEKMKEALWDLLWESKDVVWLFYSECLKREWRLYEIYWYESEEYEPSVEQTVQEIVQKSQGIVSLAHPNVTFSPNKGGINEFLKTIKNYVDQWVNAIEINTQANSEWVQAILYTQQKYNLLLTFGSDCHLIGYDGSDEKHASIGDQNPHVPWELRDRNFEIFKEIVWL